MTAEGTGRHRNIEQPPIANFESANHQEKPKNCPNEPTKNPQAFPDCPWITNNLTERSEVSILLHHYAGLLHRMLPCHSNWFLTAGSLLHSYRSGNTPWTDVEMDIYTNDIAEFKRCYQSLGDPYTLMICGENSTLARRNGKTCEPGEDSKLCPKSKACSIWRRVAGDACLGNTLDIFHKAADFSESRSLRGEEKCMAWFEGFKLPAPVKVLPYFSKRGYDVNKFVSKYHQPGTLTDCSVENYNHHSKPKKTIKTG